MHYGDDSQINRALLLITVYNHEILGCKTKLKADKTFSKKYVDYRITSIKKCEYINPNSLLKLLSDPYKFLNKAFSNNKLDPETKEGFYRVELYTTDGYNLKVSTIHDVSKDTSTIFNHLH